MKKYSIEWKHLQVKKHGGWPQEYINSYGEKRWAWHYIQYDTEYQLGDDFTRAACEAENGPEKMKTEQEDEMIISKKHAKKIMRDGNAVVQRFTRDGRALPPATRWTRGLENDPTISITRGDNERYIILDDTYRQRTLHVEI